VLHRPPAAQSADPRHAFVALAGTQAWATRMREIARQAALGPRSAAAVRQRHAIELTINGLYGAAPRHTPAAWRLTELVNAAVALQRRLSPAGRYRFAEAIQAGLTGDATLAPVLHLVRAAALQEQRGFAVHFAGLCDGAPFDLLLSRGGVSAELVCDTVSAEAGRAVQRAAWFDFANRMEPDLQRWLAAHPGTYLLRLTLPAGLRKHAQEQLGELTPCTLQQRICGMLARGARREDSPAAMLRLDRLPTMACRGDAQALLPLLRDEFGPEAHLCVTTGAQGAFAMAARAGRSDEIGAAVSRRMALLPPARLTGTRPGILAMLLEDTDRAEWRSLRERLELEREARRFLIGAAARAVVAVSCSSRFELLGFPEPDAAADGELRFRNPDHPAAHLAPLAPAVLSSL